MCVVFKVKNNCKLNWYIQESDGKEWKCNFKISYILHYLLYGCWGFDSSKRTLSFKVDGVGTNQFML